MLSNSAYVQATKDLLFESGKWLVAEDIDCRLRAAGSKHRALELEKQGRIFGVPRYGIRYFAVYQFDSNGEPIPVIQEILARLGKSDCWAIAAWFHFPNSWISPSMSDASPVSPMDALDRRDAVLLAADRHESTYVA